MHNQPSQSVAPTTYRPTVNGAACAWLAGSIASACFLTVLSYVDATHLGAPRVLGSLLAAGVAVGACGFIVNVGVERVLQRLDQFEAKVDGRGRRRPSQSDRGHMSLVTDAESVPPVGIDSETIGAARKIARGLIQEG